MSNEPLDLDELYRFAIQTGKEAGAMLQRGAVARFGGSPASKHIEKESAVDLVTQTDVGESKCLLRLSTLLLTLSELSTIISRTNTLIPF